MLARILAGWGLIPDARRSPASRPPPSTWEIWAGVLWAGLAEGARVKGKRRGWGGWAEGGVIRGTAPSPPLANPRHTAARWPAGFPEDAFQRYLPAAGAWEDLKAAKGKAPVARTNMGFATVSGRMYVFGGQKGGIASPGPRRRPERARE